MTQERQLRSILTAARKLIFSSLSPSSFTRSFVVK